MACDGLSTTSATLAIVVINFLALYAVAAETVDADSLAPFGFPLEYAPGEQEGLGLLCPGLEVSTDRVVLVARQAFSARLIPAGQRMQLRVYVPCFRNVGEQRRLASRISVTSAGQTLEHTAALVYSRPYHNPLLRIDVEHSAGMVLIQVDSWISHAAPPADAKKIALQLERRRQDALASRQSEAFLRRYQVQDSRHWWTDPARRLAASPRTLGVTVANPYRTALDAVEAATRRVEFDASRNSLSPADALAGGDSAARASLVWYCLQSDLPCGFMAGYSRELVDGHGQGSHAWNWFVDQGFFLGDGRGGTGYLGPDQANYLSTCLGGDHRLEEFPELPRQRPFSEGFWRRGEGQIEVRHPVILKGTSALGSLGRTGKLLVSNRIGETGVGQDQAELNAILAHPPAGVRRLLEQVERDRKRINAGR